MTTHLINNSSSNNESNEGKGSTQTVSRFSKYRLAGFCLAMALMVISALGLGLRGLNLGLDFTGGYLTEFTTSQSIEKSHMQNQLAAQLTGDFELNSSMTNTHWTIRQGDDTTDVIDKQWLNQFANQSGYDITPQDSVFIGSQVGSELIDNGGLALIVAAIAMMVYLTWRFEWRLACGSLVALVHDVLVVLGLFAWLGLTFDLTVLAAVLAIIGYSLNDSIVIGDKLREVMRAKSGLKMNDLVNTAIKSTLTRSLITSGTTLATIGAIWIFGGQPLQGFAIALFAGVVFGTLSSIAVSATIPQLIGLNPAFYQHRAQELLLNDEP
ncbi:MULTISPECIES: protein translocase subunit SecF [Alteromonadaceae]|uniref:protein translocase subunit SecF n=1 Tax=Alteromonadaceae TaxID=72275 RepID=UPI001C09A7F9|nr:MULTISPECIES: protein translocase subunit SecF [Aliiglaciecola]MBU2876866.1 protein translocase subunit SecF [Aliiglaciecola lipolytica]MDO6711970.1 protein translocase subunit SecF [Aliiglaciecola sp. 2_MG-2023]MDO6753056.1 protein translocase subunit SecF [Aliiglaciecola sp. 1_MG-2023]